MTALAEEYWYWYMVETRTADGAEKAAWFHGSPETAVKFAAREAGADGEVVFCGRAEIPAHANQTGWRDGDLPRFYQGGPSR